MNAPDAGPATAASAARQNTMRGFIFAVLSTVLIAANFITAKIGMRDGDGFNSLTFSGIWATAAGIYGLMLTVMLGQTRRLKLTRRGVFRVAVIGVSTGAGMIIGWEGIRRLDPSFAAFLWRFSPVVLMVFGAIFMKEHLGRMELLPIGLMVVGGAVSCLGNWSVVWAGVVMVLISCACSGVQLSFSKLKAPIIGSASLSFYRNILAAATIWIWGAVTGEISFDASRGAWLATVGGSFIGPFLGIWLLFVSFEYWDMSRSAIVSTTQPLFVLPLAWLILHRVPNAWQLAGGGVITAGAFWLAWIHRRALRGTPPATGQPPAQTVS